MIQSKFSGRRRSICKCQQRKENLCHRRSQCWNPVQSRCYPIPPCAPRHQIQRLVSLTFPKLGLPLPLIYMHSENHCFHPFPLFSLLRSLFLIDFSLHFVKFQLRKPALVSDSSLARHTHPELGRRRIAARRAPRPCGCALCPLEVGTSAAAAVVMSTLTLLTVVVGIVRTHLVTRVWELHGVP